jgi:hypothetical protein
MKKKIGYIVILVYGSTLCLAQQAISTSGGDAVGSGGTADYTVGEVAYNTYFAIEGIITQGVQQPYEIFVHTELEEGAAISLSCSAYPNPSADLLLLRVENIDLKNVMYRLCDTHGKTLESSKITGKEITIIMANLVPGLYILRVINDQKEIKTFKIIKTQ